MRSRIRYSNLRLPERSEADVTVRDVPYSCTLQLTYSTNIGMRGSCPGTKKKREAQRQIMMTLEENKKNPAS